MTPALDAPSSALIGTPETRPFIDGEFVATGETFPSTSPRDGTELARVAACTATEVDRAVRAARTAFDDGRWRGLDPGRRKEVLLRWAELIREHADELALLDSLEMGKPLAEARRVDVAGAAHTLTWYAEAVDKTSGEVAPAPQDALALVTREPLGVIGAVVPWNYALLITSWKIAPALATGNSVVLKPAEQTSLGALLLARRGAAGGRPGGGGGGGGGRGGGAGRGRGGPPAGGQLGGRGSA
ncbi:aldehyde dehydrogenase family protein, partial [Saccharopolyspora sp. 7B]|uniref:aldehyde dehydrogenase family protein n=1 Tax=Saccharopolyspora sp. 7B TaxID=2877240 RepID=UPI001CD32628